MTEFLDEIELTLTDLMQSGFSTGSSAAAQRLHTLALTCEDCGLHTGGALLSEIEQALSSRSHTVKKDDRSLTALVCRMERYIQLCREKLQEQQIIQRWRSMI